MNAHLKVLLICFIITQSFTVLTAPDTNPSLFYKYYFHVYIINSESVIEFFLSVMEMLTYLELWIYPFLKVACKYCAQLETPKGNCLPVNWSMHPQLFMIQPCTCPPLCILYMKIFWYKQVINNRSTWFAECFCVSRPHPSGYWT